MSMYPFRTNWKIQPSQHICQRGNEPRTIYQALVCQLVYDTHPLLAFYVCIYLSELS